MSTALLQEVYQETRRLYIAGSDLAKDDFRLNRLLPRLQQLGERSPVFKRIGDGVATLLAGSSTSEGEDSATQLQRLTLLVLSVLRTQGSTASTSEQAESLSSEDIILRTRLTYRQLAPVQQALTTTGGGRYEIVKHAWKEGYFEDVRLLPLAVDALADPYSDIAELAMNSILPGYGKPVLPYLMDGFDPQGGKLEVRKMKAIQAIAGAEYADFYFQTAETTKGDMKATAIAGLAGLEQYLPHLLEWSKDKKKEVRAVAYTALAQISAPEAQEVLFTNFSDASRDLDLVVDALLVNMQPELAKRLHAAAWEALEAVASHPPKDEAVQHYNNELVAHFRVWNHHDKEALLEMYRFMVKHPKPFQSMMRESYHKMTLLEEPASALAYEGNDDDVELLYQLEKVYPHYILRVATAVHCHRSPQEFYEHFSQGLGAGSRRGGRHATPNSARIFEWMEDNIRRYDNEQIELMESNGEINSYMTSFHSLLPLEELDRQWDTRWLNIALEHRQQLLVALLARPGNDDAIALLKELLIERGDLSQWVGTGLYFRALARAGLSAGELRDVFWQTIESPKGGADSTFDPFIIRLIRQFPASDIERLEQLISDSDGKNKGKFRYTAASQLRAVIQQMKEMKA